MGLLRSLLLIGSENSWLKEQLPKLGFVKKAKMRFIPGERLTDAIKASKSFKESGISTILTNLGENIANLDKLPPSGATLYVIPMPIKGGTGAPARVFAIIP